MSPGRAEVLEGCHAAPQPTPVEAAVNGGYGACQGSGYQAGEQCSCMASTCRTTSPLGQVVSLRGFILELRDCAKQTGEGGCGVWGWCWLHAFIIIKVPRLWVHLDHWSMQVTASAAPP